MVKVTSQIVVNVSVRGLWQSDWSVSIPIMSAISTLPSPSQFPLHLQYCCVVEGLNKLTLKFIYLLFKSCLVNNIVRACVLYASLYLHVCI